jgi:hypothetical protein
MRKTLETVIRQNAVGVTVPSFLKIVREEDGFQPRRERHEYTPEVRTPRFWLVREAPPETPWEARPGRGLRPRKKRRVQVVRRGQKGAKRLAAQYGERFICLRYIYDAETGRRLKTVELLVEEDAWTPAPLRIPPDQLVGVRVGYEERGLREAVKGAGARWDRLLQAWVLPYRKAEDLGLRDRVTHTPGPCPKGLPAPRTITERYTPKGAKGDD